MAALLKNTVKKWWILLVLGILSIAVGIIAFCEPEGTFEFLSTVLMIFLIVSGVLRLIEVIRKRSMIPAWGWFLAASIIYLVLAIMIAVLPYGKDLLVAFLAGFAVMMEGIDVIFASVAMKYRRVSGWGWFLALGIITIVMGVMLLAYPMVSMTFVVLLFGFAFVFEGIDLIAFSIALSRLNKAIDNGEKAVRAAVEEAAREAEEENK